MLTFISPPTIKGGNKMIVFVGREIQPSLNNSATNKDLVDPYFDGGQLSRGNPTINIRHR